jgi:predicted MPP superfamily phosphohydrolase
LVSGATRFLWTTYGGFKDEHFRSCIEELSRLKAPLGQYCVLGNHDFWSGPAVTAKLAQGIGQAGFRLLRNESARIEEGLYLCGVDDYWEKSYNFTAAMEKAPADACRILLSHNPDVNEDVDARGETADFIISGHTHGGQIVFPFIGAPFLPSAFGQKYRAGLVKDGPRYTYTTRGLGVFFVPVRLNCPPEVTLITLKTPRSPGLS